jgi:hypothetical protein
MVFISMPVLTSEFSPAGLELKADSTRPGSDWHLLPIRRHITLIFAPTGWCSTAK